MLKQLAQIFKIKLISITLVVMPMQGFATQPINVKQKISTKLNQPLTVNDQVTHSASGMALGEGAEMISFIYTIALVIMNFAATTKPESSCMCTKIFKWVAWGALAGEAIMFFSMNSKIKDLEENMSKIEQSGEVQVGALDHQKKEQETIADIRKKKFMLYTLMAVGYGTVTGIGIYEMYKEKASKTTGSPWTCGPLNADGNVMNEEQEEQYWSCDGENEADVMGASVTNNFTGTNASAEGELVASGMLARNELCNQCRETENQGTCDKCVAAATERYENLTPEIMRTEFAAGEKACNQCSSANPNSPQCKQCTSIRASAKTFKTRCPQIPEGQSKLCDTYYAATNSSRSDLKYAVVKSVSDCSDEACDSLDDTALHRDAPGTNEHKPYGDNPNGYCNEKCHPNLPDWNTKACAGCRMDYKQKEQTPTSSNESQAFAEKLVKLNSAEQVRVGRHLGTLRSSEHSKFMRCFIENGISCLPDGSFIYPPLKPQHIKDFNFLPKIRKKQIKKKAFIPTPQMNFYKINKKMNEFMNPMYSPVNPASFGLSGLMGYDKLNYDELASNLDDLDDPELSSDLKNYLNEIQNFITTLHQTTFSMTIPYAHAGDDGFFPSGKEIVDTLIPMATGGIGAYIGDAVGGGTIGSIVGGIGGAVLGKTVRKMMTSGSEKEKSRGGKAESKQQRRNSAHHFTARKAISGKDHCKEDKGVLGGIKDQVVQLSQMIKRPKGCIMFAGIGTILTGYLAYDNFKKSKEAKDRAKEIQKMITKLEQSKADLEGISSATPGLTPTKMYPTVTGSDPVKAAKYQSFDSTAGCVDINGRLDKTCKCTKIKNSSGRSACLQVGASGVDNSIISDLKKINPQFAPTLKKLNSSINRTMSGDITDKNLSLNGSAEKLAAHNKKLNTKLLNKLNQKMAARGDKPIVLNDKLANKFVKGLVSKKFASAARNGPLGISSGVGGGGLLASDSSQSDDGEGTAADSSGTGAKIAKSGGGGKRKASRSKKGKRKGLFSMGDFMNEDKSGTSKGREIDGFSLKEAKTMNLGDITQKSGKSIFKIISDRYRYSGVKKVLLQ